MKENESARPDAEAKAEPRPKADLRTAEQWAEVCEHTNPVIAEGARGVPPQTLKRWIYTTTAIHCGWGTTLPVDAPMTRAAYEAAVAETLSLSVGEHHRNHKKAADR